MNDTAEQLLLQIVNEFSGGNTLTGLNDDSELTTIRVSDSLSYKLNKARTLLENNNNSGKQLLQG